MGKDTIVQEDECPKEISSKINNNVPKRKKPRSSVKTFRKKKRNNYDPKEEARLERIVFGDPIDIINNLTKAESVRDYEDLVLNSKKSTNDDSHSQTSNAEDISDSNRKCPVWTDEDEENYKIEDACKDQKRQIKGDSGDKSYTQFLRKEYSHIIGTPKWAKLEKQEDESDLSDDEILKHSSHTKAPKLKRLPTDIIDIKALNAINKETHNEGPLVTSVEFHPTSTVSLVAGSSGILSIFHVDGITNAKLHSIKFERFPVSRARFLNEGTEILASSKFYDYCHSYNLISGKVNKIPLPHNITSMKNYEISPDGKIIAFSGRMGEIHLLTSKSKELIGSMKMNTKCRTLAFTPNGQNLITHGDTNEMYIWDVNSRTCIHRAIDDGCLASESIAVSGNNQFLATGSQQGAVNIYDFNSVMLSSTPKPLKIILNLVTSVTALKFNPSSEILAMASNKMSNAFRMVHLPSFNVFSNFPNNRTIMNKPILIDFSPSSGYLGISNNTFSALMFKLKYYENY